MTIYGVTNLCLLLVSGRQPRLMKETTMQVCVIKFEYYQYSCVHILATGMYFILQNRSYECVNVFLS